jgi:hypothetical protein
MSMQDPEAEAVGKITNSALEAGVVVRCPLHHAELIALGDGESFRPLCPSRFGAA